MFHTILMNLKGLKALPQIVLFLVKILLKKIAH